MSHAVWYSYEALRDLAQIWQHHAKRSSIRLADSTMERIRETVRRVVPRYPLSGSLRQELGLGIRSVVVAPYVVFYRVEQRAAQVIRVLHRHRDLGKPLIPLLVA